MIVIAIVMGRGLPRSDNSDSNTDCNSDYSNTGYDQLQDVINKLKDPEKRYDRRLVISAWNPLQIDKMALPPCHVLFQFHVTRDNKLSCTNPCL